MSIDDAMPTAIGIRHVEHVTLRHPSDNKWTVEVNYASGKTIAYNYNTEEAARTMFDGLTRMVLDFNNRLTGLEAPE